jgi:NADH-quinone oxidoreductase subunit A
VLVAVAGDPSGTLRQYLTILIFGSLAVLLVSLLLGISWLIRPSRRQPGKYQPYESGVDPIGERWTQSQVRYYIFALLFVMFDVEAVFIFPWATRLEAYAGFGLVEMFVFIGILVLGLVYAWRKGVLRWA